MKPLLSSLNALEIHHLKNVLEADGIRCWIRNELLSRLAGEIPFTECAMELHLVREEDRPRAEALLAVWRRPPPPGPSWTCAGVRRADRRPVRGVLELRRRAARPADA